MPNISFPIFSQLILFGGGSRPPCPLGRNSYAHTIKLICDISKNSKQRLMVAVGSIAEGKNTLYVAFRGCQSKDDFSSTLDITMVKSDHGGKVHEGFLDRSRTLPTDYILKCSDAYDCDSIVTCGHSLGGAVSSILATELMKITQKPVFNITFGAPLFCNRDFYKANENIEKNFLHYVNLDDVIPGILSLGNITSILKDSKMQGKDKKHR